MSITAGQGIRAAGADATWSSRGALASLLLCVLLSSLGTSTISVGLPTFARAFGASFQDA